MQKTRALRDRKGFSTILLIVLGAVFFLITSGIAYYMGSDSDQLVKTTRAKTSEARLNFIAECIQADFNDVYLQGKFENVIANFLQTQGPHTIDPDMDFISNLGDKINEYLAQESGGIISGDAASVYAAAYSTIPKISCTPGEEEGAMMRPRLEETEGGILEVTGMSAGRRIECTDAEDDTSIKVILGARGYQLNTRAVAIFNKAVEAMHVAKLQLDGMTGTYRLGGTLWKLPGDPAAKTGVLGSWNSQLAIMNAIFSVEEDDGILVEPGSVLVKSGTGQQYAADEMTIACYGNVGPENTANAGSYGQTCRPNDIVLSIGEACDTSNAMTRDVTFQTPKRDKSKITVTFIEAGIKLETTLQVAEELFDKLVDDTLTKGCIGYSSGSTLICRDFEGKPNSATVSGTVLETNSAYLPAGYNRLSFDFVGTSQEIDDSSIGEDVVDCNEQKEIVLNNVILLLTNYGGSDFIINITGTSDAPVINTSKLQVVADRIAQDPMFSTGEEVTVNLQANVRVGEKTVSGGSVQGTNTGGGNTEALGDAGSGIPTSPAGREFLTQSAGKVGDALAAPAIEFFQKASAAAAAANQGDNAQALAKTATSICKLMGLRNYMNIDERQLAMLALAGLADLADSEQLRLLYKVAGLYQAIESGSVQAILAQLDNILGTAGYQVYVTAEMIESAIKSKNPEQILLAASQGLRLAGYGNAATFLAGAAQIAYGIENEDVLGVAGGFFSMIGAQNVAGFMNNLAALNTALENGDALAAFSAASSVAHDLGFDQLAQIGGVVGSVMTLGNTIANLGDLAAQCKGVPWDLVCITPMVTGSGGALSGGCPAKYPLNPSCTFDYGLPTFDVNLLCNDLVTKMGFQIDCTCMYACPSFPYIGIYPKSFGISINEIARMLNLEGYENLLAAASVLYAMREGDIMAYCRLDP